MKTSSPVSGSVIGLGVGLDCVGTVSPTQHRAAVKAGEEAFGQSRGPVTECPLCSIAAGQHPPLDFPGSEQMLQR
jgi:hypothetical protein